MRRSMSARYLVVAVFVTACSGNAVAGSSGVESPTTASGSATATSAVDDPALAAAYRFIASYNDGDTDALAAHFAAGEDYAANTLPADTPFAARGRDDVVEFMAWSAASDTNMIHAQCMVDPQDGRTVDCTFLWDDLLRRTVGYVPLPGGATLTVDADGTISSFDSLLVLRSGGAFSDYLDWLAAAHPEEVDSAARVGWDSVDEAIESGLARARYVADWSGTLGS